MRVLPLLVLAGLALPAGLEARDGALWAGHPEGVLVVGRSTAPAAVTPVEPGALAASIAWATAPPVAARARLEVRPPARVVARAGDDPLVAVGPGGAVIAAELDDPSNAALRRWGYLPFVLHAAVERAAGRDPGRFSDWPRAPLPHARARALWLLGVATLALLLAAAFAVARRRARAHPEAHRALFAALARPAAHAAWSRPGIARPLGGFFLFLSATLLALGPYLYLTAVVVPSYVQPFPDVDGAWFPVDDVATLAWTLADFGMTVAFVQRFAEHRVAAPERALAAAQLWLWWQLASGLLQLSVGGALACGVLPSTHYALFARVVLVRAAMQVPGVWSLFTLFFQAAQRFDLSLGLDLLQNRLLVVALPIPCVLAGRALGRAHPSLGEPFGALLGIACGQYAAAACTFALGLVLFRRQRLPLQPLLLAGFDASTVRDLLRFGVGVVGGNAPFFLANAAEIGVLTQLLPGYPAWLGLRQLLTARLAFTLYFLYPFLDSGVPAFAEAFAAKKLALVRYYVVRYLALGHLFVALVIAFLIGAGRPLVEHALSVEWRPAARYLPLAAATGVFLPTAWLGDSFQKGAGRAGLNAMLLWIEQVLRVMLLVILVPALGFAGIFAATLSTLLVKSTLTWIVNHRVIARLEAHAFSTVIAPALAGAAWWAMLAAVSSLLPATRPFVVALFVGAAALTFPIGFFLHGLFGGFDPTALDELREAAELAGPMKAIARRLARVAAVGARLSPLRRAPSGLAALAQAAAREADEIAARERA